MNQHTEPQHILDAKGLNCPMPVLKSRKALKSVPVGETLHVFATDPGSAEDLEVLCKQMGNEFVGFEKDGDVFHVRIRRTI